jgi:hypothetical protein
VPRQAFAREDAGHAGVEATRAARVAWQPQELHREALGNVHVRERLRRRVVNDDDPHLDAAEVLLAEVREQELKVLVAVEARRDDAHAPRPDRVATLIARDAVSDRVGGREGFESDDRGAGKRRVWLHPCTR